MNKEIDKLLKNKSIVIEFINETKLRIKSNSEVLMEAEFNFYGIIKNNMFIWGSSIPLVNKKFIENIKKLRSKSVVIENKFKTGKNEKLNYFYYGLLTQDVILLDVIKEPIKLINDLLLELSGDIYILNPVNSNNNIQFIGLKKITKRYF